MHYTEIPQLPLHIPKMALKQTAIVEIVRVETPSSFFVRPINHMRDSLVFREPFKLTHQRKYKEGDFVLAPIEERTFGRCQILKAIPSSNCAKVFFVDDAVTSYVDNSCICKIFSTQCHNPCQVMHVSLARCQSVANYKGEWTMEQCDKFREIIDSFEENRFEICATEYDLSTDWDRDTLMVDLFGMKNRNISTKISIEELLAAYLPDVITSVFPVDFPRFFDSENIDDDSEFVIDSIRRDIPEDWIHEVKRIREDDDDEWAIDTLNVKEYDLKMLEDRGFLDENGCILGYIECGTIVSPSDMFIRLIHCKEYYEKNEDIYGGVDHDRWLIEDYDELLEFSQNVDMFYRQIQNQKQLSFEEISAEIKKDPKIYAMCGSTNKKTTNEGQFRRVEILSARNETAEVRYLDYGGIFHVKIKQLYKMHTSHSTQPPFSLPIKVEGIREVLGGGAKPAFMICLDEENMVYAKSKILWSMDICRAWEEMIPLDVPVVIGPRIAFDEIGKLVFSKIRPFGKPLSESLVDKMADQYEDRVVFGMPPRTSKSSTSSYDESI